MPFQESEAEVIIVNMMMHPGSALAVVVIHSYITLVQKGNHQCTKITTFSMKFICSVWYKKQF